MKQNIFLGIVILSMLAPVGCGATQSPAALPANETGSTNARGTQASFEMPQILKLALGTVKLDESAYPVDDAQAADLLPLWKAYRNLSQSDSAAAEELQGLVKQIQNSMSAEQIQAIEGMNLSMREMASVSMTLGIETNFGGPNVDASVRATAQASVGGDMRPPGGGFPMDGGGPPDGFDPQVRQTVQAGRSTQGGMGFGLSSTFLDALVQFLEAKIQ
jgi:hypothetical protein